jgi:LmbE family N-acetylglucosaminyl deacetylase
MLKLDLPDLGRPLRLLCLGAHSDDIEIGCGATLLRWLAEGVKLDVDWVVFSGNGARAAEAETSARRFLAGSSDARVTVRQYRDGYFPESWSRIKDDFEGIRRACSPDLVLTHYHRDLHQDHRTVSELTWNTFRDHLVLEYEILKFDGDLGNPNLFLPVDAETARRKALLLREGFPSQRSKPWFTEEAFLALMRIRGIQAGSTGYAEAFFARKLTF